MNFVLDTGYYLLASRVSGRSSAALLTSSKQTIRLGFVLHMSELVWMECVSHSCYANPTLPPSIWEHSDEVFFLHRFPAIVRIDRPAASAMIEAATNLRKVIDPTVEPRRRRGPNLVDAVTAQLVRRLDAEVLVTADRADFELLLPGFDGEIWTPRELVDRLYVRS
ncbi:MAG: hypothetical protein ACHQ7M_10320 [Chloroflexota bacterium]